jgi:hypothetical protein
MIAAFFYRSFVERNCLLDTKLSTRNRDNLPNPVQDRDEEHKWGREHFPAAIHCHCINH